MNIYMEQDAIMSVCSEQYHELIFLQNVLGMGLGYKYINGQNTGKQCIQIFVEQKISKYCIHPSQIIPICYKGFLTDVVEMQGLELHPLSGKIRPLKGGYGLSPVRRSDLTGTLGCIVYNTDFLGRKKDFFALSNNHILADSNKLRKGTIITQPGAQDGGTISDLIGSLYDFVEVKSQTFVTTPENLVDAAIAKLADSSLQSTKLGGIGDIKGVTTAKLGMKVRKVGRTTGLTDGKVTNTGAILHLKFNGKTTLFKDQIVCDLKNDHGDSGSVILETSSSKVVGLLFSGTSNSCIANNIKHVLDAFKVKVYSK